MFNVLELSKKICKYCVGMEGNISEKTQSGMIIKASGSKLDKLGPDDLVEFDFDGKQVSNFSKRASMELGFHRFLLGFNDINYVAHTHPINTLKILCSEFSKDFANFRIFPEQVVFNDRKSCLVPYSKPGEELDHSIRSHVNLFLENENFFPKVILLENHGLIVSGKTVEECVIATEMCEKAAEVFIGALTIGRLKFLSDFDLQALINDDKEKYRKELL
jgi:L-fuculose-phosphate aldolase